ncbi:unnamed protein product [Urochloa decumbens]|uniref:Uncharacterized protein n=1 Tax=Urochloa decumbens TaxID=240449 RepID=A0ABC8WZS0_9POAL
MGEKSSMFHEMFERDDALAHQAIDFGVGDYDDICLQGALGFKRHGGDPIQDTPLGEDHGQMADSMASKNVEAKAYAGTSAAGNNVARGQWIPEEDTMLRGLVEQHGKRAWSDIAKEFPGRIGKQCRERWINHLDPEIKNTAWTEDEELLLVKYHKKFGKKWVKIAKCIPGRSENSIKNQWYAAERSLDTKRKNKTKEPRPGIVAEYIRGLKEEEEGKGTQAVPTGPAQKIDDVIKVPAIPGSNFAASSQVPAPGDSPVPPPSMSAPFLGLNAGDDDFPLEDMFDDPVFIEGHHQQFSYQQENGYLPSPYALAPEHPSAEDQQAFSNFLASEDDPIHKLFVGRYYHEAGHNQVLAGPYNREAGPSHHDNGGSSGNTTNN